MNAVHSLVPLALVLASPLAAAQPMAGKLPEFAVVLHPAVVGFHISQPQTPFLGIVLVSPTADVRHFLVGLPPLLDQGVVVDLGFDTQGMFSTRFPDTVFPPGMKIFAQGVTVSDAGILSSEIASFVVDATGGVGG